MFFPRYLALSVFVAFFALFAVGCSTVEMKKTASTVAGDKQEEAVKCDGFDCSSIGRPRVVIVAPDRHHPFYSPIGGYDAGAGRGYYRGMDLSGGDKYGHPAYYTPPKAYVHGLPYQWTDPVPEKGPKGEIVLGCWSGQRNIPIRNGRCEDGR